LRDEETLLSPVNDNRAHLALMREERNALADAADGLTPAAAGEKRGLAPSSVVRQRASVIGKLSAPNLSAAVAIGLHRKLID
jgi:hypothetical protein